MTRSAENLTCSAKMKGSLQQAKRAPSLLNKKQATGDTKKQCRWQDKWSF